VVRNQGTVTWVAGDGFRVSVVGLPDTWLVSEGELGRGLVVPPGATATIAVDVQPPPAGAEVPNSWWPVRVRMALADGTGFGDPRREVLGTGWMDLPRIAVQPLTVVVEEGGDAVFAVVADGVGEPKYQWLLTGLRVDDDERRSGAQTSRLVVRGADRHAAGEYRCAVSTDAGVVRSAPARLVLVGTGPDAPRLTEGRADGAEVPAPRFSDVFPRARLVPGFDAARRSPGVGTPR
jgi:hypothetical protein